MRTRLQNRQRRQGWVGWTGDVRRHSSMQELSLEISVAFPCATEIYKWEISSEGSEMIWHLCKNESYRYGKCISGSQSCFGAWELIFIQSNSSLSTNISKSDSRAHLQLMNNKLFIWDYPLLLNNWKKIRPWAKDCWMIWKEVRLFNHFLAAWNDFIFPNDAVDEFQGCLHCWRTMCTTFASDSCASRHQEATDARQEGYKCGGSLWSKRESNGIHIN